jgi:dipeptidyl-peptidase-4
MKHQVFIYVVLVLVMSLLVSGSDPHQARVQSDSAGLNVDQIFDNNKQFKEKNIKSFKWLGNQLAYTMLSDSTQYKEYNEIVIVDLKSGKEKPLMPLAHFIPANQKEPLKIEDYELTVDQRFIMVFTNPTRVWRVKTKGDYWVLDTKTKRLFQLGKGAPASSLMFAKFSPDNRFAAYVRENNIYLESLLSNEIFQLTHDGNDKIINGTFDWVYEEEFGLRDGFRFNGDGSCIAFWQLDTTRVPLFHMIDNTSEKYPKITSFAYPKAGEPNSIPRIGIIHTQSRKIIWADCPSDFNEYYYPRISWNADGSELLAAKLNRQQNHLILYSVKANSGQIRKIVQDTDAAWVDVSWWEADKDLYWTDQGKSFFWMSDSGGWKQIYKVNFQTGQQQLITNGKYDVTEIKGMEPKGRWLYFYASLDNAAQRYLYGVNLKNQNQLKRITPLSEPGTHRYRINPDFSWAVQWVSSFEQPSEVNLIRLPDHKRVKILEANVELKNQLKQLKKSPVEFFKVQITDQDYLDGWCMKPWDFQADKKYPVLFYVYGEPFGQAVVDRWSGDGYLWNLMLTQKGYIVICVDNRSTPAPKGREWRKIAYKKIGDLTVSDQANAVQSLLKQRPYLDKNRLGVWGWSGGGTMSLNLIFKHPALFKMAMAVAPVPNLELYDSIYQERISGLLSENPESYKKGSPIHFASQLQGKLLIVHGTGDDNVHYQGTECLIDELIKANKLFDLMIYPNRSHSIKEGENTRRHLYTLLTLYLEKNL